MNETVKAALLAEREIARNNVAYHARELKSLQRRTDEHRAEFDSQDRRLMAVEAFLRDNGVDLAAVDAEAEKARPSALSTGLTQGYEGLAGQIGRNASMQSWAAQNGGPLVPSDAIMGGLAKALDEA